MDRTLITAAVGAVVGAATATFLSYMRADAASPKATEELRAKAAQLQQDLDSKIANAVLSQAAAIIPSNTAKVYPPVGKPAKQVRKGGTQSRAASSGAG